MKRPDTVSLTTAEALPPQERFEVLGWLRAHLFNTWYNSILTVVGVWFVVTVGRALYRWGVTEAAFGSTPETCRGIQGACWSVIGDMWPLFVVGPYTYAERWRPMLVAVLLAGLGAAALVPAVRRRRAYWTAWMLAPVLAFVLLRGTEGLGLPVVETYLWGGLLLTLTLTVVGLTFGFPLAMALALGRQSEMPIIRSLSVGYIEMIRGVPLITVLFMSSVMLPLFMPQGFEMTKLLRAQVGIIIFEGATLAEIIRGGLQAIPRGQKEAAMAVGLRYWSMTTMVVLPQALRIVIPALVGQFISLLKNTSLVVVIGLFDLLGITEVVAANPDWMGRETETYLFVAAIYWCFCWSMSLYSRSLERRFRTGQD